MDYSQVNITLTKALDIVEEINETLAVILSGVENLMADGIKDNVTMLLNTTLTLTDQVLGLQTQFNSKCWRY